MFRPSSNPSQQIERLFMKEQDLRERADQAEAEGDATYATWLRRKASRVKGARTRVCREQGWI